MTQPRYLREVTYTLTANEEKPLSAVAGNFVKVYSSTDDFKIDLGNGFQRARSGSVFKGIDFSRVTILDTSGSANEVILKYGTGDYDDTSSVSISGAISSKPASSSITTTADASVASSASAQLLLATNANRSSVLIQRIDSTSGDARLGDSNVTASRGARVKAGESIEFKTTAPIYVFNNTGSSMTFTLTEE